MSAIDAPAPTGTAENDGGTIVFSTAAIAPGAAPTHTTPTGWTLRGSATVDDLAGGLINVRVSLYSRIEPASPATVTLTASANCAVGYIRESDSNVDISGDFGQVTFSSWGGATAEAGTITTTRANASIKMWVLQGAALACAPDASLTERIDNATYGLELADAIQGTAGATGNKVATPASSSDGVIVFAEFWSEISNQTITLSASSAVNSAISKGAGASRAAAIAGSALMMRSALIYRAGETLAAASVLRTAQVVRAAILASGAVASRLVDAVLLAGAATVPSVEAAKLKLVTLVASMEVLVSKVLSAEFVKSAEQASSGVVDRATSLILSVSSSLAATAQAVKVWLIELVASVAMSGNALRMAQLVKVAAAVSGGSLLRLINVTRSSTTTTVASTQRATARSWEAAQSHTGSIMRAALRSISSGQAQEAMAIKGIEIGRAATTASAAEVFKGIGSAKTAGLTQTATATRIKAAVLSISASLGGEAIMARATNAIRGTLGMVNAAASKSVGKPFAVVQPAAASALRSVSKLISVAAPASAALTVDLIKHIVLTASTASTAMLGRVVEIVLSSVVGAAATAGRMISKGITVATQSAATCVLQVTALVDWVHGNLSVWQVKAKSREVAVAARARVTTTAQRMRHWIAPKRNK